MDLHLNLGERTEILSCLLMRIKSLDIVINSTDNLGLPTESYEKRRRFCLSAFEKISNLDIYYYGCS